MALNFIPGVNEITIPISLAASAAKTSSPEGYEKVRSGLIGSLAALQGFLPINPVLWPFQGAILVIITLLLVWVFKMGVGKSILFGYLLQAIIITFAAKKIINLMFKFGLGI